jgi:uncharacterized protein (DUF488 family)
LVGLLLTERLFIIPLAISAPNLKKLSLWTIGHGSRKIDEFILLLKENCIELLIDVRRFPTSKTDHFKREKLRELISSKGIEYEWLGDKLGGFRKGGYESYMQTEEFKEGIRELVEKASKKRVCIMCLEISPKGCHRRFISMHLGKEGHDIFHILSKSKVERQTTFHSL